MTEHEKIIDKIRKLKNLANPDQNTSENEIAAALAMARKLMLEHNISESETALISIPTGELGGENESALNGKKIFFWTNTLASAIANYFDCKLMVRRMNNAVSYVFYGPKSQTEIASYVFNSVYQQIQYLADNYKIDQRKYYGFKSFKSYARIAKNEYKEGLAEGLFKRCIDLKKAELASAQAAQITALAIRSESIADEWIKKNKMKVKDKTFHFKGTETLDGHFTRGVKDSEKLALTRGELSE